LQQSEKNRAENIMIVDMVRNDLGRVAQAGSVSVPQLFALEQYPTLWQMTSTVRCSTKASVPEIFRALFPAASITGAPKVRTMQIIHQLETSPRRIYTGAIGFIAPRRQAQFNVAIRTVLVDKLRQRAEYGVGGGIVWDSTPAAELAECATKAKVLTANTPGFALLETMLWSPGQGYFLLDGHLCRLSESAEYFSRRIDLDEIKHRLAELSRCLSLERAPRHRVRLQVNSRGEIFLESHPQNPLPSPYRLTLAEQPLNSADVFLYHKTTHRQLYENPKPPDCEDVLFWNERRELTESTIANLVIEKQGHWLTPPLSCGLLPGVYRSFLLQEKKVKEETIRLQDLTPECQIYLVNSLRGMWPARLNRPTESDDNRFATADRAGRARAFFADRM
jgi:para-aminobenzoate synthetase/4-amino-4-deoxychorismate lyase